MLAERLFALSELRNKYAIQENFPHDEELVPELEKFYLGMVNPSLQYLEEVAQDLISMPDSTFHALRFAVRYPTPFFQTYEKGQAYYEQLRNGMENAQDFMNDIFAKTYDLYSHQRTDQGQQDPKTLAASAYEAIQIRNGEREINAMTQQIRDEFNLHKRCRLGERLKQQTLDYIGKYFFSFSTQYSQSRFGPTWINLIRNSGYTIELTSKRGWTTGDFGIRDAVLTAEAAITRHALEKRLARLRPKDTKQFNQLRLQFGAKAANMIILSEHISEINKAMGIEYKSPLAVPESLFVPVTIYQEWKEGKSIDTALQTYFERVHTLHNQTISGDNTGQVQADYIVRSSAVYSEDGEKVTGAGIYESVRVKACATFDDFKEAVIKVYASVESPQAKSYREQNGIVSEKMGLVIQPYISPEVDDSAYSTQGYVNSKLHGVPKLMEVVTKTSRNFVRRDELDFFLGLGTYNEDVNKYMYHFPPDMKKVRPSVPINIAMLTLVLERIWGENIQIEFVDAFGKIYIVQVRELPGNTSTHQSEVSFPDEEPVHTGASIGIGDTILPMLSSGDNCDNSGETGVVVFENNERFSVGNYNRLPKKGAVIIYQSGGLEENGHIQTLCAQKGLVCIFPDRDEVGATLSYHALQQLQSVRIVSDGMKARVYSR